MSIIVCPHTGHFFILPADIHQIPGNRFILPTLVGHDSRGTGQRVARRVRDAAVPYYVKVVRPPLRGRDGHEVLAARARQACHGSPGAVMADCERPAVQGAGITCCPVACAQGPVPCDPGAGKVWRIRPDDVICSLSGIPVQRLGSAVGGDKLHHEVADERVRDVHGNGDRRGDPEAV